MPKEFQTIHTKPDAVCPWCGAEQRDSWEISLSNGEYEEGDGEYDCQSCEKTFIISRYCEVTYSTKKIDR